MTRKIVRRERRTDRSARLRIPRPVPACHLPELAEEIDTNADEASSDVN
jgi:hypothetical protein